MSLPEQIRSRREEKRRKQPFQPALYARIGGLVKAYGLDEAFLRRLQDAREPVLAPLLGDDQPWQRVRPKEPYQPPLFSLATEEEYRLTMAIIRTVDNPYLAFVTSPEELLLCGPLFRRNPSLGAGLLARVHFQTLLRAEVLSERLRRLADAIALLRERRDLDEDAHRRLSALQERVAGLRRSVARVEGPEAT